MKRAWILVLLCVLAPSADAAKRTVQDLSLRSTYQGSAEPLTTEKIWTLDPDESNPHRQRWVLYRFAELKGLQPVALSQGKFGVHASGIEAEAKSFIRGPGPWYRDFSEFRCEQEPVAWFGTPEGARKAADTAAKYWDSILKSEKMKLSLALERIQGDTPAIALKKADMIFHAWLVDVKNEWRVKGRQKAKMAEWRSYLSTAASLGKCKPGAPLPKSASKPAPLWESMMEPIPSTELPISRLLTRAPARRWNGLFSVRLMMQIGTRKLNGQFLIDSAAGNSVVSPSWVQAQGVPVDWIKVPGAEPQRVVWSGGGGMALRASIDSVEMNGYPIGIKDYLLIDTDLFGPPENLTTCCDGILGSDFLRKYAVEFVPGPPAEIKIWPREDFHWSPDTPWVEMAIEPGGTPINSCLAHPKKGKLALVGARWDTGSEAALDVHTPWQSQAAAEGFRDGSLWQIHCGDLTLAKDVPVTFPRVPPDASDRELFSARVPAFNVGIPVLARGNFTFDLPHGRLWFSKDALKETIRDNDSGLDLQFVFRGSERVLKVKWIRPRSPAAALTKIGLKPGLVITFLDSKPTDEMDLWEVNRRLAGEFGEVVSLEWQTKSGIKVAPLQVR